MINRCMNDHVTRSEFQVQFLEQVKLRRITYACKQGRSKYFHLIDMLSSVGGYNLTVSARLKMYIVHHMCLLYEAMRTVFSRSIFVSSCFHWTYAFEFC